MSISTTTHLNFRGDAREALEFYAAATGGHLVLTTYGDMGPVDGATAADQIVWGQVETAGGFRVMAFDVPLDRPFDRGSSSFFVSLRGTDEAELRAVWNGLADGAAVVVPLAESPWSPLYGMLVDRFGVTWVLDIAASYPTD